MRKPRKNYFSEEEDLNPMNFVSNLSDVMLILTVGIMLALILHWNVNINPSAPMEEDTGDDPVISFSDNDLESRTTLPENMTEMGQVFYDEETDRYYIVKNGA